MKVYRYTARDKRDKAYSGIIEAQSRHDALQQLRQQGLLSIALQRKWLWISILAAGIAVVVARTVKCATWLVALTAVGGVGLYLFNTAHARLENKPASPAVTRVCPTCGGTKQIKCPTCGGFGSVEKHEKITCGYCKGKGSIASGMTSSYIQCPYCNGSGMVKDTTRETCQSCLGKGYVACPDCAKPDPAATKQPEKTWVATVKAWFVVTPTNR